MSPNVSNRPEPGPDCARYALLLPLLDAEELSRSEHTCLLVPRSMGSRWYRPLRDGPLGTLTPRIPQRATHSMLPR
jgi:hypothetical protein